MLKNILAASALLAAAFAGGASAESSREKMEARNKALVEAKFAAWADGTGGPYDILAEGAVWTITGNSLASKTYENREAFMSEVIRPFNGRMSVGLKPSIRHIYTQGETVVIHFDATGTARDNVPYTNTYAWFLDLRDGQIVKATAFFDSIAFNDLWQRVQPAQAAQR